MNAKQPKIMLVVLAIVIAIIVGLSVSDDERPNNKSIDTSRPKETPPDLAGGDTNNDLMRSLKVGQDAFLKKSKKIEERLIRLESVRSDREAQWERRIEELAEKAKNTITGINNNHENISLDDNSNGFEYRDTKQPDVITEVKDLYETRGNPEINFNDEMDDEVGLKQEGLAQEKPKPIPFITIPKTSTLADVKLMSPIVAQIPVAGRLLAPAIPFKAIVGRKNLLAANGARLPQEISGMVVEGYSVGDMSLQCARGYVTNVLFVFDDGHFVAYPEESAINATEIFPKNAIGYIGSNSNGTPCIPGEYVDNMSKVIPKLAALSGLSGGAQAFSQSQLTTIASEMQVSKAVTGNVGKFMAGTAANEMAKEGLQWYKERVHDVFDAVYIPSSHPVDNDKKQFNVTSIAVNITKTIELDHNKYGRVLKHEFDYNNENKVSLLD